MTYLYVYILWLYCMLVEAALQPQLLWQGVGIRGPQVPGLPTLQHTGSGLITVSLTSLSVQCSDTNSVYYQKM